MKFLELREKFDCISYDKFVFLETNDSYDVDYHYTLGEFHFVHKLNILKRFLSIKDITLRLQITKQYT